MNYEFQSCLNLRSVALTTIAIGCSLLNHPAFSQSPPETQIGTKAINEGSFVKINGIEQWILARGDDPKNPILLYLHGGPGAATSVWAWPYFERWGWEKHFTVVHWDQPGSGHTFAKAGKKIDPKLTIEQIADDGTEVAKYLTRHYRKRKIVLVGGSWGSGVGLLMIKKRPDLFYVYVGTAQVVNKAQNEAAGYARVLRKARERNGPLAIKELETSGPPPYKTEAAFRTQRKWANVYEVAGPLKQTEMIAASGASSEDATVWFEGLAASEAQFRGIGSMLPWNLFDAYSLGPKFGTPIFVFQGTEDDIAPADQARAYVDWIVAPKKKFVAIDGGGHNVDVRRGDEFLKLLLEHVRPLTK